jgi:hypothetical protein
VGAARVNLRDCIYFRAWRLVARLTYRIVKPTPEQLTRARTRTITELVVKEGFTIDEATAFTDMVIHEMTW